MTRLIVIVALSSCLYGQQDLKFEVASIKPLPADGPLSFTAGGVPSGPHLRLAAMSLCNLIWWAYDVKPWQVTGGPSWAGSQDGFTISRATRRFDIDAKAEGDGARPIEQFHLMLRNLLAERFHLAIHNERRETPVYALTIGKGGLRMHTSAPDAKSYIRFFGPTKLSGYATLIPALTAFLSLNKDIGRPVVDRTALTSRYDFSLEWSSPNPDAAADAAPGIFAALEQLGLRLVPQNALLEYIVIDHADLPDAN